jgi:hypothetical protein
LLESTCSIPCSLAEIPQPDSKQWSTGNISIPFSVKEMLLTALCLI